MIQRTTSSTRRHIFDLQVSGVSIYKYFWSSTINMPTMVEKLLAHPQVRIKNPNQVEQILQEIVNEGSAKLQVISDFDQTLTKDHDEEGKRCPTTFGIFHGIKQLPESYSTASNELFMRFHKIEIHPNMSVAEKTPYMEQWYKESEKLLVGTKVTSENVRQEVNSSAIAFRDGSEAMFKALLKADVPVLVFSAGVGDVVKAALEKHKMLTSNVRIISNFLHWDTDTGDLTGFNGDMIHVFNKNQRAIAAHEEYFSLLAHRPNVILLGDNEGDAQMGHGVQEPKAIIKIGFLFQNREARLNQFMDQFDIVLLDDQTMNIPITLLEDTLGCQISSAS